MPTAHDYRQHDAPSSPDDDSDSGLELELDELDLRPQGPPNTALSPPHPRSPGYIVSDFARRIPLRNLRAGRRRRNIGDDQDLDHLLGNDRQSAANERYSRGSLDSTHDDAPLLPTSHGSERGRPSPSPQTASSRLGRFFRPFSSSAPRFLPESDPARDYDEPEEEHDPSTNRHIFVGQRQTARFPLNAISNAKYTLLSFLPRTLYNEFKFFLNLYFLFVALSQIIPQLRIGYLSTYVAPLAFVLVVTLGKEATDDIARRKRDAEANMEPYVVLIFGQEASIDKRRKTGKKSVTGQGNPMTNSDVREVVRPSRDLKVGDVLKLSKNQRVPADVVVLQSISNDQSASAQVETSTEPIFEASVENESLAHHTTSPFAAGESHAAESAPSGEVFIRTDQLDGETDWKLRLPSALSQGLELARLSRLKITAAKPDRKVNEFVGMLELDEGDLQHDEHPQRAGLGIDNTAWANTVLASSTTVYAAVIYTGSQTRQALSTSASRSKVGLLELELNTLVKILCALTLALSGVLVLIGRAEGQESRKWYISVLRFLILFSMVVPISLRVNLDMGKTVYARFIERDKSIPGTIVRTSTIPEDLGRIEYLLSDKTGTLTQNEMELRKVHVGTVSYANEAMDEVASYISQAFTPQYEGQYFTPATPFNVPSTSTTRTRREIGSRIRDLVMALAICHNVTPTTDEVDGQTLTSYQASSPDEIAIVRWTELIGLRLIHRDRLSMTLESLKPGNAAVRVRILTVLPFTSESKRMGIIVRFKTSSADSSDEGETWFYQKGADTVMASIVAANDWLDEETANMAREGLRTLVVGRKRLSRDQYREFTSEYSQASMSLHSRDTVMADVVKRHLERDLELLGVTGVEDKLQQDIKPSLELLRNAGIKIWMLTGDKVETARCIAISSKLVARGQYIHTISKLKRKDFAYDQLNSLRGKTDACLLIDGESLTVMLTHLRNEFISIAVQLPAVVACRCSPTQKAEVAKLIKAFTKKRVACIGDGGNDVSMIQAADVGVGIVGKEGRQASLAADFSINQFHYLTRLLVWHGRNSYKRSAKLAQFVIHRGLIISVCQTMFSVASKFEPDALYRDWLLVGYATLYTLFPVFSLVLDRDVSSSLATLYPELYKELRTGRSLSYKTFFVWVGISVYQGCMIQGLSQLLVGVGHATSSPTTVIGGAGESGSQKAQEVVFKKMVAVSYTVLILTELFMVGISVTTWHPLMSLAILLTGAGYFASIPFLGGYLELKYVITVGFVWRVAVILAVTLVPVWAGKLLGRFWRPSSYRKVRGT